MSDVIEKYVCYVIFENEGERFTPMGVLPHVTQTGMPVSKLCVFTGFETGRCLYLWWQIKQSAEIGAVVSLYAQYSPLPLYMLRYER